MDDDFAPLPDMPRLAEPRRLAVPEKHCDMRKELADFVILCLKAATHHILFSRTIYPGHYFRNERVFDTFTKACRHPDVKAYISDVLESMKEALLDGRVSMFCVAILHEGCTPHELLTVQPELLLTEATQPQLSWEAVDDVLRGVLLQLHHLQHALPAPHRDCEFRIFVQTDQPGELPAQDWARDNDPRHHHILAAATTGAAQSSQSTHQTTPATQPDSSQGAARSPHLDAGLEPAPRASSQGGVPAASPAPFVGDLLQAPGVARETSSGGTAGYRQPADGLLMLGQAPGSQVTPAQLVSDLTLRPLVDASVAGVFELRVDAYFRPD